MSTDPLSANLKGRGRHLLAGFGKSLLDHNAALFIGTPATLWIDGQHVADITHTDGGCGHEYRIVWVDGTVEETDVPT